MFTVFILLMVLYNGRQQRERRVGHLCNINDIYKLQIVFLGVKISPAGKHTKLSFNFHITDSANEALDCNVITKGHVKCYQRIIVDPEVRYFSKLFGKKNTRKSLKT